MSLLGAALLAAGALMLVARRRGGAEASPWSLASGLAFVLGGLAALGADDDQVAVAIAAAATVLAAVPAAVGVSLGRAARRAGLPRPGPGHAGRVR
ncbi:hypothetical protein [Spirillospora sp. NPDC047279]|uniref:hypothetical protein n=1 Tax=Spirillospora sp. NPDC047279 TaxID=3155478 RepID=UPI0033ED7EBA